MQAPYPLITVPHVDQDARTDKRNYLHWEMAIIHNVYLRAVNTVWTCAPLVTPKDHLAFVSYALIMTECIHSHHHGEETIIFPVLATKLTMEHNLEQHEMFQDGMKAFEKYLQAVIDGSEKYDGGRVRELLTTFGDPLAQHLHDEVPTLVPEEVHKVEKADFDGMMTKLEDYIKSHPGLFTVFPLTLSNHDSKQIPNWPPIPGPLRWFVKNIAVWRYSSYWKFSAFDMEGNPRVYSPA